MKTLSHKIFYIFLTIFLLLLSPRPVHAEQLFSDSFLGGYNSSWTLGTNTGPVSSTNGITGSDNNNWNVLQYSIDKNIIYEIQFDLFINKANSTQGWGLGIGDTPESGHWKLLNPYQSVLELRESTPPNQRDILFNWDKTIGKHHFKLIVSPNADTNFVVIEDDSQLVSWKTNTSFNITRVWISLYGHGDFEYANFILSSYEEPTPTPTPTPTATPTATPTPTSTPTPTPSLPKKVVVLPGMGGSWNKDALLNCKSIGYSGEWIPWKKEGKDIVYQSLFDGLTQAGYETLPYYYDWRQQIASTVPGLAEFVQRKSGPGEKIDIVGHSLGGLIARSYAESVGNQNNLDKLLMVGSAQQGSVIAYPAWSGGEMWVDDVNMRLAYALMQVSCLIRNRWNSVQTVQKSIPSLQNVLPVFEYLKDTNGNPKPVLGMNAQNNWHPAPLSSPYYGITTATLNGTGYNTLQWLEVNSPNRRDQQRGYWTDGKPTGDKTFGDGDGTVLAASSTLPDIPNITLPLDHTALVTAPVGINTIIDFLNGNQFTRQPTISSLRFEQKQAPKRVSALFLAIDRGTMKLTDHNGSSVSDDDGQITIINPKNTQYTLTVIPEIQSKRWPWNITSLKPYTIIVIQLFDDGTTKWKEYKRISLFKTSFKLRFDRVYKPEDILHENK